MASLKKRGPVYYIQFYVGTQQRRISTETDSFQRAKDNRLIADGLADMIAFGRPFIANPDLVARFAAGAPLANVRWKTVYASGAEGYIDYSEMECLMAR